jgi:hypothetical protein
MAAPNQDKLLEILKSLKPPDVKSKDGPAAADGDAPPAVGDDDPATASGRADASPADPAAQWRVSPEESPQRRRARGTIELRLEEVGIFFLAAVVLVVLAFLMGWYGHGIAGGAAKAESQSSGRVEVPGGRVERMDEPAARDLGERPAAVKPSPTSSRMVYSILVARFPAGGEAEAEDHRRMLEERGYTPSWIRRTTTGVELCVGRFEIPTDALARSWLPRLRKLHGAYASSQMVRIPAE